MMICACISGSLARLVDLRVSAVQHHGWSPDYRAPRWILATRKLAGNCFAKAGIGFGREYMTISPLGRTILRDAPRQRSRGLCPWTGPRSRSRDGNPTAGALRPQSPIPFKEWIAKAPPLLGVQGQSPCSGGQGGQAPLDLTVGRRRASRAKQGQSLAMPATTGLARRQARAAGGPTPAGRAC